MEEDQWHLVYAILRHACTAPELRIPVTCKIRIFAAGIQRGPWAKHGFPKVPQVMLLFQWEENPVFNPEMGYSHFERKPTWF
jgi:hypothetical protein